MLAETFNQVASKPRIDTKYSSFSYQSPTTVPIDKIQLPLKQPRRYFDPNKLTQLIQSIKQHGILEPVLVRPLDNGEYELVAGERRIRAAHVVGLVEVPIVLRELDDKQALQVALMENLQREDLNPVEETEAVLDILALSLEIETNEVVSLLHRSFNAKQRGQQLNQNDLIKLEQIESILSEIGKFNAASFRSSRLPLLNLPSDILSVLRQGEIEYTKAQAIARVKPEELRSELLKIAIAENLSLSEIKTRVKNLQSELQTNPKKIVTERFSTLTKLLHKKSSLIHTENSEKITKLLDELEKVIIES
ncbi:ParB/RepB/Spo0J family partition protein [Nostoc sp. UHCC 0252]|uniref:ParB/RepB/Spo0J family partition protein n=1 Tax=Nostoc sp. UHCC 0252 TaxID=3110241 RepID=UPI002B1EA27C|nr:ParB/RepB/Spo0J family partition protein [Nostoc sp. UHCC 0252]MEA5602508.1 ParB/RepB/Spo0J family partition protein [Nostoc sp. UHCC 0252]